MYMDVHGGHLLVGGFQFHKHQDIFIKWRVVDGEMAPLSEMKPTAAPEVGELL